MKMKNNTILITGGASGIGYEMARQLCGNNMVIITGRNGDKLEKAKQELKNVHAFQCDIADPKAIVTLFEEVSKSFSELNILINNAGVLKKIDLHQEDNLDTLIQEVDTNLNGTIRMCAQFLPLLKKQKNAAIVNVSSALAFVPLASTPVYCATKAALHSFTQSLRIQLKNTNVKVIELLPSVTGTSMIDEFEPAEQKSMSIMSVSELVKIAIKKMECGTLEIRPGQSGALRMMSRVSPSFALNMLNKSTK